MSLVLIASRHDSHAELVCQALAAGKAVFVEKPLALTRDELARVREAYIEADAPLVMVGFNRRFAPLVATLRDFTRASGGPWLLHYRVNAGYIPREHWTQDREQGGGRIIGEMCHFIDLLQYLVGCPASEVSAYALPDDGRYALDNVTALLRFPDGSVGSIVYAANGDTGLGKERLEVFGGERVAVLDDFRGLTLSQGGRRQVKRASPDKGHRAEMAALVAAARGQTPSPVPFDEALLATATSFAVVDALLTGAPQPVTLEPAYE